MKLLIQRVKEASVSIDGSEVSHIGAGLLILLGVGNDDTDEDCDKMVKKAASLRIFDDGNGVMNRSVLDVGGEVMVVSQFTLMAATKKGNRPSYVHAAGHDVAIPLYERFCREMHRTTGKAVATGRFGADMQVALVNDGPVTIILDSKE